MNFFRNDICCSLFVFVQYLSHFLLLATPRTTARQASLSLTICQSLPKFMSIESVMPFNLSSDTLFSFCLQSRPASGYFLMSQLFVSGGQVLELQHQFFQWIFRVDFLSGWLFWSPCCSRDSQESYPAPQFESINSSVLSFLYGPILTSTHDCWKNHSLDYADIVGKVMSLLFNMLSRFVIAFLPRSKHLLVSWLQSLSEVILKPKKIKSVTVSPFPHLFAMKWWDWMP